MSGAVLVTARSADGVVAVLDAVAELFAGTGSVVAAVTDTSLVSVAPANSDGSAVAVTVNCLVAPGTRVPMVQVSGVPEQPVAVAPSTPEPGVSVSTTPVAVEGPLLVTVTG